MKHQINSDTLSIGINSQGAELCSIKNSQGLEYLWQADKEVWPRHAPVLFPIVGRLKNNQYHIGETPYSLSQHGFARDMMFEVTEQAADRIMFELRPEPQAAYPFEFVLRLAYHVEQNRLHCRYQVLNPAQQTLYFSLGAHPGFNCPLLAGETFEEYYLEFEKDDLVYTELDQGLRTDKKHNLLLQDRRLPLKPGLFDRDALVFENSQINRISLCSLRSGHKISMDCLGWPYFGIWTKPGCDRFVCLEPWYGVADHVNASGRLSEKEGIVALGPGKEFSCSFSLSFS